MSEIKKPENIPIILAPLAGVTDAAFRSVCFENGADFAVTEMVSAQGLMHCKRDNPAMVSLLNKYDMENGRLAVQIFGREPQYMADAAARLSEDGGYAAIDINMGCPAPKVTSGGNGSALMKKPLLCADIFRSVAAATMLPVTAKIRLGWDDTSKNALEICRIAREEGISAVTIHGRTRAQMYSGRADWAAIGRIKAAVKIPIIANGDVFEPEDAIEIISATGADGVMIARGALGNPFLFSQIKQLRETGKYDTPDITARIRACLTQYERSIDGNGYEIAIKEMRKHVAWYLSGFYGSAQLKQSINRMQSFDEVRAALLEYEKQLKDTGKTLPTPRSRQSISERAAE